MNTLYARLFGAWAGSCLTLLCLAGTATAQTYPDTILIHLPDRAQLQLAVPNAGKLDAIESLNALLQRLEQDLAPVQDSLVDPHRVTVVRYVHGTEGRQLTVQNTTEAGYEVRYDARGTLAAQQRQADTVYFPVGGAGPARLTLPSVTRLADVIAADPDARLREVVAKAHPRFQQTVTYNPDAAEPVQTHFKHTDQLEITGGAGVGVVRDKLVPDLALNFAFRFSKKAQPSAHYFAVSPSLHYFFARQPEGNYKMDVNTFVSVAYARRFPQSIVGLGAGYLVRNKGDYFGDNTIKLFGWLGGVEKNYRVYPELIITDNFKTVFPGIRFGIGIHP
ncbi:hypothetical protein SAMN05421823_110124 [Catalinimonas alkaloidigena]|uniref:Outer membrane protein beta-barrel domain-containing protein n=1 Tax=Catalinimonas alkaloidigena TaxID=1075417 RepID=A0A1G9QCI8_9BACT|nr:hypothetical protein [Catalinimonas alkaloidigena]SDM08772.1 hypothetical protein SAMN05421823_110124 [Catalinimonas alkaloidigena]